MPNAATVTFKCPPELLDQLPAPGNGRSRFIVRTLMEKFATAPPAVWRPCTPHGRKLAALLEAGKHERGPGMTEAEVERELLERRGGVQ